MADSHFPSIQNPVKMELLEKPLTGGSMQNEFNRKDGRFQEYGERNFQKLLFDGMRNDKNNT
jgi:hypothetical protein